MNKSGGRGEEREKWKDEGGGAKAAGRGRSKKGWVLVGKAIDTTTGDGWAVEAGRKCDGSDGKFRTSHHTVPLSCCRFIGHF